MIVKPTTSVKGLLQDITPTIPEATTYRAMWRYLKLYAIYKIYFTSTVPRNWKWFYFLLAKYSAMKKYLFPPDFLYICIFVTLNGFTSSYKEITWKHKTQSLNDPFIY